MAVQGHAVVWGAAGLFLLLCGVYAFSIDIRASRGASITGDEPFYLLTTQSLIQDGDLDLRNQYAERSYREFFDHSDELWRQSVPTPDGRLLSPHNPGLSVLVIPGYLAGGLVGVQVQLMLLSALAFALTFVLVERVVHRPLAAWLCTLAVAVTATPFIYATEVYPEIPAALALAAGLLVVSEKGKHGAGRAVLLTVLLTCLAWLGVKYAALAVPVAVYFLVRAGWSGRATLAGLGALSATGYAWSHLAAYGALTPYHVNVVYAGMSTAETFQAHIGTFERAYRLYGLFIDERFGLGRWAPVLLAGVAALPFLWGRGAVARLALILICIQVLIATFMVITMMGWWFPGRTLTTVLPLFALPLAVVAARAGWRLQAVLGALAIYSGLVTLTLALAGHAREVTMAVDPFAMASPVFGITGILFPDYRAWTGETAALTAAWLAAGGTAVWGLWRWRGARGQDGP